ncbi:MAG: glycerophosphodiester phosphodiesterase [Thermoprotei archaeon]
MGILDRLGVKPFAVIGHRGSSSRYPENTIAAIEYAISTGVDIVEVDIRSTRDGKLVVFHDPDFKRLFGIDGKLRDVTYDWIRSSLRLGDQTIPLLEEVLDTVKNRVGLFAEIKEPEITEKVVETIREYGLVGDTAIISFYDEALEIAKRVEPGIVTGLIYYKPPGRIIDAKKLGASIVLPRYTIATAKANELAHRLGLKVVVWTVNDVETAREMVKRGADGIATDYPEKIIELRTKYY